MLKADFLKSLIFVRKNKRLKKRTFDGNSGYIKLSLPYQKG